MQQQGKLQSNARLERVALRDEPLKPPLPFCPRPSVMLAGGAASSLAGSTAACAVLDNRAAASLACSSVGGGGNNKKRSANELRRDRVSSFEVGNVVILGRV